MKKQTRGAPRKCIIISLSAVISGTLLAGCTPGKSMTPVSTSGIYFDTCITVSLYDYPGSSTEILNGFLDLCQKYEDLFSATAEGSDIWNINHAEEFPVYVSDDTAELISDSIEYCRVSDGQLDITLGGVSELWDFSDQAKTDSPEIPDKDALNEALSHVDYTNVSVGNDSNGSYVTLADQDADLELGFIAKGYIADRLKEYLSEEGVSSAVINLGGNVYTLGTKPDRSDFTIGIQKPFDAMGEYITTIHIHDTSVVSSGVYERYFRSGGKLYHHILSVSDGYPVDNGLYGVSIECASSERADALSTMCFIMGLEDGLDYIESQPDVECMYITDTYDMICSSGWK